jgi:hypothetical protein
MKVREELWSVLISPPCHRGSNNVTWRWCIACEALHVLACPMRLLPTTCEAARAQEVSPGCITKHLETDHHVHTRDQRDARTRQPLSPDTCIRTGHDAGLLTTIHTANCLVSKGTHGF